MFQNMVSCGVWPYVKISKANITAATFQGLFKQVEQNMLIKMLIYDDVNISATGLVSGIAQSVSLIVAIESLFVKALFESEEQTSIYPIIKDAQSGSINFESNSWIGGYWIDWRKSYLTSEKQNFNAEIVMNFN